MNSQRETEVFAAELVRQAVLNTSSSVELFREAVSNSVDAGANAIAIALTGDGGDLWDVLIEDDGHGMADEHMSAFFNAGQTVKDTPAKDDSDKEFLAIGEKGLGSKTTFVAERIIVESARDGVYRVGIMESPLQALKDGKLPTYTSLVDPKPAEHERRFEGDHGTLIRLEKVLITKFNGEVCDSAGKVAERLMHYLRSLCATGTVKLRHSGKKHVKDSVVNVTVSPELVVVVNRAGETDKLEEISGYPVPEENPAPTGGPAEEGVERNSYLFCDVLDFSGSRTVTTGGAARTIHYDGTAIIAGQSIRSKMLEGELKPGWNHKSQMGLHLAKDFIPLRNDTARSREFLGGEYYYDFKVFLNSQAFRLNADRNVVTNLDNDDVAWILEDFQKEQWPKVLAKSEPYRALRDAEDAAIDAVKKAAQAENLKSEYGSTEDLIHRPEGLLFVKTPRKEADTSHLFAMMVQSGLFRSGLAPVARFGQYIDASTDVLVETEDDRVLLVEVETKLGSLFQHGHPLDSYDLVVVWTLGNLEEGDDQKIPWGQAGEMVTATLKRGPNGWFLKWGTENRPILVLSEILENGPDAG